MKKLLTLEGIEIEDLYRILDDWLFFSLHTVGVEKRLIESAERMKHELGAELR